MEKELTITPKTLGGLVRSLSGLFITKENPSGLTPKECTVLAILLSIVKSQKITKEIKIELSKQLNQKLQVTINYINKFKAKGVITKEDRIHPLFFKNKITIQWKEFSVTP